VLNGQQLGFPGLDPFRGGAGLTLGTMAVAARVRGMATIRDKLGHST
jgi:hypothetical protein